MEHNPPASDDHGPMSNTMDWTTPPLETIPEEEPFHTGQSYIALSTQPTVPNSQAMANPGYSVAPDWSATSLATISEEVASGVQHELPITADPDAVIPSGEPPSKRRRFSFPCNLCGTDYTARRTLLRHQRSPSHLQRLGMAAQTYPCQIPDCQKVFTRNDFRIRHLREVHDHLKRKRSGPVLEPEGAQQEESQGRGPGNADSPSLHSDQPGHDIDSDLAGDNTGGSIVHPTLHAAPSRESIRSYISQEFDRSSTSSSSTSANRSGKSFWNISLPFRSRIGSAPTGQVNPRPFPLRYIKPCPMCGKEFGSDGPAVKKHIDAHLKQLGAGATFQCPDCQIGFVHEKDLKWHLQSVWNDETCGFNFQHVMRCSGHHSPNDADHARFKLQIWEWEQQQHREFRAYADEHADGLAPTNAPAYNDPPKLRFRMSTGSLVSISARSYLSRLSAPGSGGYKARLATGRSMRSALDKSGPFYPQNDSFMIFSAVGGDFDDRSKILAAETLYFQSDEEFKTTVAWALQKLDFEMVLLLFDLKTAGKAMKKGNTFPYPPVSIEVSADEWLCCAELDAHVKVADYVDLHLIQQVLISWASPIVPDVEYFAWFYRMGVDDRLARIEMSPESKNDEALLQMMWRFKDGKLALIDEESLIELVRFLLGVGALVNCKDKNGQTPLHLAVDCAPPILVTFLLEHGALLEEPNDSRRTPLGEAIRKVNLPITKLLLDRGASVHGSVGETTPLISSIRSGVPALVMLLLDHGATLDSCSYQGHPMAVAIGMDNCDIVRLLLERSAIDKPFSEARSSLSTVTSYGSPDMLKLLLNHGAPLEGANSCGITPLGAAIGENRIESVTALLDRGASFEPLLAGHEPLLTEAAEDGSAEMVTLLLNRGISIDPPQCKRTPLMAAVTKDRPDILNLLLDHGASIDRRDSDGNTALMEAAKNGNHNILGILLSRGGNPHITNHQQQNAVHMAVIRGRRREHRDMMRILSLLVTRHVNVSLKDCNGKTPLMYTRRVCNGPNAITKLLMEEEDIQKPPGISPLPLPIPPLPMLPETDDFSISFIHIL